MKTEKLKFEKIETFKRLIELTGLTAYSIASDEGRGVIVDVSYIDNENLNAELVTFLRDFHEDVLHNQEGLAQVEIIGNDVHITWIECRDVLLEHVQNDFNELLCSLFSLPNKAPIDILVKLNFDITGTIKRKLEFEKFVFVLRADPSEIFDCEFSESELKKIKAGMLIKNTKSIQLTFEKLLKKFLEKRELTNCSFSIVGDECGLSIFSTFGTEKRRVILTA